MPISLFSAIYYENCPIFWRNFILKCNPEGTDEGLFIVDKRLTEAGGYILRHLNDGTVIRVPIYEPLKEQVIHEELLFDNEEDVIVFKLKWS